MGGVKDPVPVGLTFKLSLEGRAESQSRQEPAAAAGAPPGMVGSGQRLLCRGTSDVINLPGRQYSHLKNESAVWTVSRALRALRAHESRVTN